MFAEFRTAASVILPTSDMKPNQSGFCQQMEPSSPNRQECYRTFNLIERTPIGYLPLHEILVDVMKVLIGTGIESGRSPRPHGNGLFHGRSHVFVVGYIAATVDPICHGHGLVGHGH
jgi:hypothetical protein